MTQTDWIRFGTGMVYKNERRYEAAEKIFNELIARNPADADAYAQLGLIRMSEGKKPEAAALFETALHHDPCNVIAHFHCGCLKIETANFNDAQLHFSKVLEIDPAHPGAMLNMGCIIGREGDFKTAEKMIRAAYDKDSNLKDGFARLGWIKADQQDWDGVLHIMQRDLEENRISPGWQINLAQMFGRNGNFDRATALIVQAYAADQTLTDGFARLGWIKAEQWDWDGALEIMQRDMEENRISPGWQINLAQVFGQMEKWDRAAELIAQAYAADAALTDGYARLGWLKAEQQDWNGAFELMIMDHEINRLLPEWRHNLAMIQIFKGDDSGAEKLIETWYSQNPDATDGYAKLGRSYYLKSRDQKKLQNLVAKDLALNRLSGHGRRVLTWVMNLPEELTSAEELLTLLYAENPSMRDGFAMMGWLQCEAGDSAKGLALMEKDYQLKRMTPFWQTNYVYQLSKANQSQKARTLFREVMQLEPFRKEFRIGFYILPQKIMTKEQLQQLIKSNAELGHIKNLNQ